MARVDVYVERGSKRDFAVALAWPGWARSGRDEATALEALLASAPRYAKVVSRARLGFTPPRTLSDLRVVERLQGNATTDFGAPGAEPEADRAPVDTAELRRLATLIEVAWRALDDTAKAARGKALARGPRGGGRSLEAILRHVREAEGGYLSALGWKLATEAKGEEALVKETRRAVLEGLAASARGEIPAKGPRGGVRWQPRRFARRLAWHAVDHAWEIEDRRRVGSAASEKRSTASTTRRWRGRVRSPLVPETPRRSDRTEDMDAAESSRHGTQLLSLLLKEQFD
ncbi:MAG TPA: hypothetical protein VFC31_05550 [Candidatus Limnocylindria bacterium]|nr:hypothetical protein [Candidatus Limnocylindria bacterium]